MTLRHFKIFVTVCEAGSMTGAAELLHMTQPPVSQAIAEMERHYGVRLFERFGRSIYLTQAGEKLLGYASHILHMADDIEMQLTDLSKAGTVRIGASMTIGTAILPMMIRDFLITYPTIHIQAVVDNSATIIQQLNVAKLDLGLVEGLGNWSDIVKVPFCDDELALICPPEHQWVKLGKINAEDLEGQRFVVREEGSGTRDVFEAAMKVAGIRSEISGVFNNSEAIINAVSCGMGFSFISFLAIQNAVKTGKIGIVKVDGLDVTRKFNLVYHKNKFINSAMNDFMGFCLNFCKQSLFYTKD